MGEEHYHAEVQRNAGMTTATGYREILGMEELSDEQQQTVNRARQLAAILCAAIQWLE